MAIFRATVLRELIAHGMMGDVLYVNTVHDSVMYDVRDLSYAAELKQILEANANSLVDLLEAVWGIEAPVPFKIEVSAGPSWADQKPLEEA